MLGADDYIIKPFSLEELALKIDIFLKRSRANQNGKEGKEEVLRIGKYRINLQNLLISDGSSEKRLTYREGELIRYFYYHMGKLVTREEILTEVWGENDYFAGRSLDVFISRLRKYFKDDPSIILENRHGIGFILRTVSP
jgi:DNA-binding response OmpR family regulator